MRLKVLGLYLAVILSILAAPVAAVMQSAMEDSPGTTDDISGAEGDDYLSFLYPQYGSDISFSSYEFNMSYNLSSAFSFFSEFYTSSGTPVVGGIISNPAKFDIAKRMPSKIYFGTGLPMSYSQYLSTIGSRSNALWIQGEADWSQFVVSPAGKWLQLVTYAPNVGIGGEKGDFYEIVQNKANRTLKHNEYLFFQGYNTMSFNASQAGRHILFFLVNNQPSNVVVIDVFAQPSQAAGSAPPGSIPPSGQGFFPPGWPANNLPTPPPWPGQTTGSAPAPTSGDTSVTIKSTGMSGYQVFLDEVNIGTEGSGGDPQDGSFSFRVKGDMYHDIRVWDGQFNYPKRIYFERGVQKIIYVEPGTVAFI